MESMQCGFCRKSAPLNDFCHTPVLGALPKNVYQCPHCKRAFEKRFGKSTVYASGLIIPGKVSLAEVSAVL